MVEAKYPEYQSHKANHDMVLDDCKRIMAKNVGTSNLTEFAMELVTYMENWFIEHYANEDVKMADYLKQNLWRIS